MARLVERREPWSTCCDVCFNPHEHLVRLDLETFGHQLDLCAACLDWLKEVATGAKRD